MRNDLTKTMPVLIFAETYQKGMFLRKYIIEVAPGFLFTKDFCVSKEPRVRQGKFAAERAVAVGRG